MSYEQKARTAAEALRAKALGQCERCGGFEHHLPNCPDVLPALLEKAPKPGDFKLGEPLTLEQAKAVHIARVLREKKWNKTHAARALAVDRRTLYHLIERYGIRETPATSVQCSQCECVQPATHSFLWPGHERLLVCGACAELGRRIADAMGFALEVNEL